MRPAPALLARVKQLPNSGLLIAVLAAAASTESLAMVESRSEGASESQFRHASSSAPPPPAGVLGI